MKYTVDIDIGGTMTDGLFSDGNTLVPVKVDTTPHDFTVCFFDCLREGAKNCGYDDLAQFLSQVKVIRWSSTIATNVLAEGKGPKLGLLISEGHASDLYGSLTSPAVPKVIQPEHIVPVSDSLSEEEILLKVRGLLEKGVRRICISLKGAYEDPRAEQRIKSLIEEQFPDHYLGAVPVLLGSDILHHPDDQTRTHLALINSYVHTPLAVSLFKAEDDLMHQYGYRKPVYIGHVNGGVARVAKTKGVDTTESGPVFGLQAAAYFAKQYALDKVITLDVGGTTTKLGLILDGEVVTAPQGDLFGIPLQTPWILLRSVALGGGSIARVKDGQITLGPDSMGAFPGPACYDLGGEQATLTDAFLVMGAINPRRFLGGRRTLEVEQARMAVAQHVAQPLNLTPEEAAQQIVEKAVEIIIQSCQQMLEEMGMTADGFSLFTFGGNGSNFATLVAEKLGLERAYVFHLGPVLSAFGSSVSNICHIHEQWPYLEGSAEKAEQIEEMVLKSWQRVLRDMEGEGLSGEEAAFSAELVLTGPNQASERVEMAVDDMLRDRLRQIMKEKRGFILERIAVKGVSEVGQLQLPFKEGKSQQAHPYGTRTLLWDREEQIAAYSWDQLDTGHTFRGPAVLESDTLSCLIIPGWQVQIDGFNNAVITRGGA